MKTKESITPWWLVGELQNDVFHQRRASSDQWRRTGWIVAALQKKVRGLIAVGSKKSQCLLSKHSLDQNMWYLQVCCKAKHKTSQRRTFFCVCEFWLAANLSSWGNQYTPQPTFTLTTPTHIPSTPGCSIIHCGSKGSDCETQTVFHVSCCLGQITLRMNATGVKVQGMLQITYSGRCVRGMLSTLTMKMSQINEGKPCCC